MTPWLEAAFARYSWIVIGLTFGFAAKYALLLKRGIRIQPWLVVADVLLLPMVALIAYVMVSKVGVQEEAAALLTAGATVGADRLVKLYTERFLKAVETEAERVANDLMGKARETVQAERSAVHLIDDTMQGRAPEHYVALDRQPKPPGTP